MTKNIYVLSVGWTLDELHFDSLHSSVRAAKSAVVKNQKFYEGMALSIGAHQIGIWTVNELWFQCGDNCFTKNCRSKRTWQMEPKTPKRMRIQQ